MVMNKKFCLALLLMSLSNISMGGTCITKIKSVYPLGNGDVKVKSTVVTPGNVSQCPTEAYNIKVGTAGVTGEGLSHLLSVLLAAGAANKDVYLVHQPDGASEHAIIRAEVLF